MIVLDTSVVLAFMDRRDADHGSVRDWMERQQGELVTTPLVLAELDHLILRQGGTTAARAMREDFANGAYTVEWWPSALRDAVAVANRYESMELGLADASLVALADRLQTTRVATLDERHFRAVRPLAEPRGAFELLPLDER